MEYLLYCLPIEPAIQHDRRILSVKQSGKSFKMEMLFNLAKQTSKTDDIGLITESEDLPEKACFVRPDYQEHRILFSLQFWGLHWARSLSFCARQKT